MFLRYEDNKGYQDVGFVSSLLDEPRQWCVRPKIKIIIVGDLF